MKVAVYFNGSIEIRLSPEGPLEKLALEEMAEAAGKGKTVTLSGTESGATVSVER